MILRSVYFWAALGILTLIIWLIKGQPLKLIKIAKVLGALFMRLLDLFFALFNLKIERLTYFEEPSEI